jgi:hypothetical protein
MDKNLFPQRDKINPRIYAIIDTNPQYEGLLRIGQTSRTVEKRVKEQYPTERPGNPPYKIVLDESAMRSDGTIFTDHDIFRYLRKRKIHNPGGDFYDCDEKTVKAAILAIKNRAENEDQRTLDFKMRPEQEMAVKKTFDYFTQFKKNKNTGTPRFLWNAKMRFGKTFAAYQLAKKIKWKRILILTYLPVVQNAWKDDLTQHLDFNEWQFFSSNDPDQKKINKNKPLVCFGSFQDYLGKNKTGNIKSKNEWVHEINWDCIILDEYHYGSWNDRTKETYDSEEKEEYSHLVKSGLKNFNQETVPLTTHHYLYLSGTPFRAIASGEFIEEQIFNWTYMDEQNAKSAWTKKNNPYLELPRMVMLTYKLPSKIGDIALKGEFDEFDLNEFFKANGKAEYAKFKYLNEVQKWLELIRGNFNELLYEDLKQGSSKPPMPFSDHRLKNRLNHTVWFLPSVSSCYAMANLLKERQNTFYSDFKIIIAAGAKAGIGAKALPPVLEAMNPSPEHTKTITLTCEKLLTGVSVKPWTGIFMLRNTTSAQRYFQSAFRVQTPWRDGDNILKEECYVFDFAPNRTLSLVSEYCKLDTNYDSSTEKKIDEFLKFLPILAYDGFQMHEVNAKEVMEIADSGTSSTLLAKKWIHDSLIEVDNITLQRILNDPRALEALMKIEGFRDIKNDIETIINKTDEIKNLKGKSFKNELDKKDKKLLSDAEKEHLSKKELIKKKLKQFISRIPIFMYLTDYREEKLEDVITKLEPSLFKKVTGLTISDFDVLVGKGVFNESKLNMAIGDFKNYEDSSLTYLGISTHKMDKKVGLFNTSISKKEYENIFVNKT